MTNQIVVFVTIIFYYTVWWVTFEGESFHKFHSLRLATHESFLHEILGVPLAMFFIGLLYLGEIEVLCEIIIYCHCSYSYALEECRERALAEEVARRALTINKTTPFATHAMGEHYFSTLRL